MVSPLSLVFSAQATVGNLRSKRLASHDACDTLGTGTGALTRIAAIDRKPRIVFDWYDLLSGFLNR